MVRTRIVSPLRAVVRMRARSPDTHASKPRGLRWPTAGYRKRSSAMKCADLKCGTERDASVEQAPRPSARSSVASWIGREAWFRIWRLVTSDGLDLLLSENRTGRGDSPSHAFPT